MMSLRRRVAPFSVPCVRVICLAVAIALLAGCGGSATPGVPATVRLAGSTSMLPLLDDLAVAFAASHDQVRFEIAGGGSRLGLERALINEVDVAACSWLEWDDQAASPQTASAVPVAWDGIAVVVHPLNRLDELTLLQLKSIYAGWVFDWEDLGGLQADILTVSREDGSGTRAAFEQQVLGEQPVALTAIVMPSSTAVLDYVSSHPAAVGYVSMGAIVAPGAAERRLGDPTAEPKVKVLAIEGALPTAETVKRGVYHLARPLYLVTAMQPQGDVREFIDFVLSPAGQAVVGRRLGRIR